MAAAASLSTASANPFDVDSKTLSPLFPSESLLLLPLSAVPTSSHMSEKSTGSTERPVFPGLSFPDHTPAIQPSAQCPTVISPSPNNTVLVRDPIDLDGLQTANTYLRKETHQLAIENTKLRSALKATKAELKARTRREEKLVTKILRLESAIVVIQHQRDRAQAMGLAEFESGNAARHMLNGVPYPHDALVAAAFQPAPEPDMGEDLEDLALSANISDYMDSEDDDSSENEGSGMDFDFVWFASAK